MAEIEVAFANAMIAYSVIVPVFNSSESLKDVTHRITQVLGEKLGESFEIILVDDGSENSETWPTMLQLAQSNKHVRTIQLMKNFGKHAAVLCGMAHSRGRHVFTIDDDLQHAPEDFPAFIAQKHHDVVIGVPARKHHSPFKRTISRIKDWFEWILLAKPRHIRTGPFKLFRSSITQAMVGMKTSHPSISALMLHCTRDIVTVEISHFPRKYGTSSFSAAKMFQVVLNMMRSVRIKDNSGMKPAYIVRSKSFEESPE